MEEIPIQLPVHTVPPLPQRSPPPPLCFSISRNSQVELILQNLFETIQLRKELSEMVEKMAETEKHGAEMRSLLVEKDSHISRITEELQNMVSEFQSYTGYMRTSASHSVPFPLRPIPTGPSSHC